jgi:hypothetical protein
VRRSDYGGALAARLIERINAEPPESALLGTHLTLLERNGYPSLIAISDEGGCFEGGARLSSGVVRRIFGDRS